MKWIFHGDDGAEVAAERRRRMVEQQLRQRGVDDERVLQAMERVPREAFVPANLQEMAFADGALPIGQGQTISQPYVVGVMSAALEAAPGMRILEVGTGSGYQAAVLAEMGLEVYTIEYVSGLAREARDRLEGLGYQGIHYKVGDGRLGWLDAAPFDGIIVTAAPVDVPPALGQQLGTGRCLVIPLGRYEQELRVYRKNEDGSLSGRYIFAVRFVPLVGD